jgi:tetratricopeptide (TPR) repeat protein
MISENFAIVLLVLGLSTLVGAGSMMWAYQGSGSIAVLFLEVIPAPDRLTDDKLRRSFNVGVGEYCKGYYRRSMQQFVQVLKIETDLPEAHHNYALALANQRQDDKATASFLKAAELYLKLDDRNSADLVKQHLLALRQRKFDREAESLRRNTKKRKEKPEA